MEVRSVWRDGKGGENVALGGRPVGCGGKACRRRRFLGPGLRVVVVTEGYGGSGEGARVRFLVQSNEVWSVVVVEGFEAFVRGGH